MTAPQVVKWLGLESLLAYKPHQLSGGQQRRVALGRALLAATHLLLLDEPLTGLNQSAKEEILEYLYTLVRKRPVPMLYVSHNRLELSHLADHMVQLENGRSVACGDMLTMSANLDAADPEDAQTGAILSGVLTSHEHRWQLSIVKVDGQYLTTQLQHHPPGTPLRILIPARDVSVSSLPAGASSILNIIPVTLTDILAGAGAIATLKMRLQRQYLLAQITRKSLQKMQLQRGQRLYAQIKTVSLLRY
jgi:molybdate transport system ATP-binding protein